MLQSALTVVDIARHVHSVLVNLCKQQGWDFSGYSRSSGFRFLLESNKNGFEMHFDGDFSPFRIQTLAWSHPWNKNWDVWRVWVFCSAFFVSPKLSPWLSWRVENGAPVRCLLMLVTCAPSTCIHVQEKKQLWLCVDFQNKPKNEHIIQGFELGGFYLAQNFQPTRGVLL